MLYWALQQKWVQPSLVLGGFVAGAVVQSVFGIGQVLTQATPVSSWLGLSAHDPAISGTSVVEAGGYRILRAYGSLPHPNILGGYLATALLATFGFYLKVYESVRDGFKIFTRENIRRHIEGRQWYIKTAAKIAGLFLIQAALLLGLLLTFSRSAWVGFAAACLITLVVIWLRKVKWGIALWIKWSAALLIISGVVFAIIPSPFVGRGSASGRLEELSTTMRQNQYQDAWALIKMEPLRGVGYGNMVAAIYDKLEIGRFADKYQPVHNIFILSAVELGIVGGLVFLAFCWLIIRTGIQHALSGSDPWRIMVLPLFVCLLVVGLFDHYLWTLQPGVMLWWLVVGLAGRKEES
jgi:O-antigen ligase